MKRLKKTILLIALVFVSIPLIDMYILENSLGKTSFGLFSIGIFIHSINLIMIGIKGFKEKRKVIWVKTFYVIKSRVRYYPCFLN